MRKYVKAAFLVSGVVLGAAVYALADKNIDGPRTVDSVDLERYTGKWYEIARYPNRFQRNCAGDVSATYTLRRDGKIEVVNTCRRTNGELHQAKGTASVADRQSRAKLNVTFFWPFSGDYWIIDLAPDYTYAVVSEPHRKYLWILSRKPHMDETEYSRITTRLEARGFDTARLIRTRQESEN